MKFIQPSLSGGEMAPGLQGRVDITRYAISLKTCRNFVTRPTGGAVKRPGFIFRGEVKDSSQYTRLLPFVYSTEIKYLIEAGPLYFRFWVDGARLEVAGVPVEVVTPYTAADLPDLRITQSADVLYLVHPSHAPRELRRLTATSFELRDFAFRRGPFRSFNTDAAATMAVNDTQGVITVTSSVDKFSADMVGSLLYFEERELRSVKPWEPLDRSVQVGDMRRSDSKVYKCVSRPTIASPGYVITGNTRPLHELGRAFDGPQDTRSDGVNNYIVGVEWEYVHGGFGVVEITAYTNARTVTATVIDRVPDSIIGTVATPSAGPWTFSGDSVTRVFNITGAISDSYLDYEVVVDGTPTQSNPYSTGTPCPEVGALVISKRGDITAGEVEVGDWLLLGHEETGEESWGEVTYSQRKRASGVEITTAGGSSLRCSTSAPIPTDRGYRLAPDTLGRLVLVRRSATDREIVMDVRALGEIDVQHITVGNRCFWVSSGGGYVLHHNAKSAFDGLGGE